MEEQGGSGRLLRRTPVGGFCLESSLVVQVIPNHSALPVWGRGGVTSTKGDLCPSFRQRERGKERACLCLIKEKPEQGSC